MSSDQTLVSRFHKVLGGVLGAIFMLLTLAACSFSPVYSNGSDSVSKFNLTFDEPASRLEQIVYADLVAHFGRSSAAESNNVSIKVGSSNITPGSGSVGLSGTIVVTNNATNETIFTGTRTASATYASTRQALANQQAANDASERAAHQLAEAIRLTLIGVLSFPQS